MSYHNPYIPHGDYHIGDHKTPLEKYFGGTKNLQAYLDEAKHLDLGIDLAVPNKHRYQRKGGWVQLTLDFEPKKWWSFGHNGPYNNWQKASAYWAAKETFAKQWVSVDFEYKAEWK